MKFFISSKLIGDFQEPNDNLNLFKSFILQFYLALLCIKRKTIYFFFVIYCNIKCGCFLYCYYNFQLRLVVELRFLLRQTLKLKKKILGRKLLLAIVWLHLQFFICTAFLMFFSYFTFFFFNNGLVWLVSCHGCQHLRFKLEFYNIINQKWK